MPARSFSGAFNALLGTVFSPISGRSRRPGLPTFPVLKAAVSRVKAGSGRGRILFIGDSTDAGEHGGDTAGSNGYNTGATYNSTPYAAAAALTAAGIQTSCNAFFSDMGSFNYSELPNVINPQFSYFSPASAYKRSQGMQTMGGGVINVADATNTGGYCSYGPRGNTTDFLMFLINNNVAYGTYGYSINGGATQSLTLSQRTTAQSDERVYQFALPVGTSRGVTVNMNRTSGGALQLVAGFAWDRNVPAIDVLNAGNRGSQVQHWIDNAYGASLATPLPWSAYGMIGTLQPDLVVITPPINDLENGNTVSNFMASLQTLVQRCQAVGADVMLVNATGTRAGGPNNRPAQSARDAFTAAMSSYAASVNIPFTDLEAALGPWDSTLYYDDLHPLKARYALAGQKVAQDIQAVLARS